MENFSRTGSERRNPFFFSFFFFLEITVEKMDVQTVEVFDPTPPSTSSPTFAGWILGMGTVVSTTDSFSFFFLFLLLFIFYLHTYQYKALFLVSEHTRPKKKKGSEKNPKKNPKKIHTGPNKALSNKALSLILGLIGWVYGKRKFLCSR